MEIKIEERISEREIILEEVSKLENNTEGYRTKGKSIQRKEILRDIKTQGRNSGGM